MWGWLASFISAPIVNGLISGYKAKLEAGNTSERIAADLAQRELAVQQTEIQAHAQLKVAEVGHPWEPEKLFAYILVIYFGKVFLWDAAFHLGSTDAVRGDTGQWAGMIMIFYFGKRGIENVARILKR
jgi:hypothetical protein